MTVSLEVHAWSPYVRAFTEALLDTLEAELTIDRVRVWPEAGARDRWELSESWFVVPRCGLDDAEIGDYIDLEADFGEDDRVAIIRAKVHPLNEDQVGVQLELLEVL